MIVSTVRKPPAPATEQQRDGRGGAECDERRHRKQLHLECWSHRLTFPAAP